ncbi:hypothetical protein BVC80_7515g5 [Macleaya cordata]|uniref:Secreted protein n=1 Tax=Macleaya cordata TaxID=56857 RepID=A0A200Q8T7_MACCD|nr:hypothetical protein BVC80_7515g5 [Macleaya cordata]
MGLQLLVVLTKLKLLLLATSHGCSSNTAPIVTPLVFLFILKIPFIRNMRREYYTDLFGASRLFFFRLSRIIFEDDPTTVNGRRWVRALRLVREWVTNTRRPATMQSDEDSLHVVSMLAL